MVLCATISTLKKNVLYMENEKSNAQNVKEIQLIIIVNRGRSDCQMSINISLGFIY